MKILLPVDGSEASLDAVRFALRLMRDGLDARFVLANVQAPSTLYEVMVMHDAVALERIAEGAGEHQLASAAALLDAAGAAYEREIVSGDAAHALLELVESAACDAVIVGAHGGDDETALLHGALGSVAQWLVAHASVPVTVVRPPAAEPPPDTGAPDEPGAG
jgi:nucleotide-binding universal stress UspA family protein